MQIVNDGAFQKNLQQVTGKIISGNKKPRNKSTVLELVQ